MKQRTIKVDYLARVEGEGGLTIKVKDDQVTDVKLRIFEPPRFFEAFLRDRRYDEAPDITARICGICPVAYQMSASHAMEDAFSVTVDGTLRDLRRLLYCGEWIESHVLHVFMLHAPDFLGFEDAIRMAAKHGDVVTRGLQLKKIGNDLVSLLGGREIHPINVCVGGFYKAPKKRDLEAIAERLKWARDTALETLPWLAELPFPEFEQDYEYVALRHPDEYPLNEGRLVSNKGLDIPISEFYDHIAEEHVEHSTSLHSSIKKRGHYHVGPLARFNLNFDKLPAIAREAANSIGFTPECRNPFKSILARGVETIFACDEAIRIIEGYEEPEASRVSVTPKAATGHGCTEAPRGILYHRYILDDAGLIRDARIVPPTAQNQKTIESDLMQFVPKHLHLSQEQLTWQCEQAVRNYDPCISCSAHFLNLRIERE